MRQRRDYNHDPLVLWPHEYVSDETYLRDEMAMCAVIIDEYGVTETFTDYQAQWLIEARADCVWMFAPATFNSHPHQDVRTLADVLLAYVGQRPPYRTLEQLQDLVADYLVKRGWVEMRMVNGGKRWHRA